MTVAAVSMVKDEADIIAITVRHMLEQVDFVVVADNGSTDGSREALEDLHAEDLIILEDPDPAYYQSRKMTQLAAYAGSDDNFWGHGADWIVPFDADERWYSPHGRIADVLSECDTATAPAALYDHVATGIDPDDDNPVARIGWRRREPVPLPKVACRPRLPVTIEQGNHGAWYPFGETRDLLVVRHYPYRSAEQFVRKARNGAAAYKATDLPDHIGAHWRQYGAILDAHGEQAVEDIFREWYWTADPTTDPSLIFDPCP